jgi:hypothetical protein
MPGNSVTFSSLPAPAPLPARFRHRALEMLVALSLAFLVWLYIRTRDHESLDHVQVPVQVTLTPEFAEHYDLELAGSPHVVVSFIGPPSGIRELRGMLQRGEVRVSIPVSVPQDRRGESRYRDTVRVQAGDVPVPPGVTALVAEGGNRVPLTLHRLGERELPVRLNNNGEERISEVTIDPPSVMVRGPEDILERARFILTRPYHLPPAAVRGPARSLSVQLPLLGEMEGRPVRTVPAAVQAQLALQPRPRIYQLKRVPVKFLCPPSFPYRPQFAGRQAGTIALRVRAPAAATPPAVVAFVDLTGGGYKPGLNVGPLRLQLPRECQLAQDFPGELEFELIPTETAAGWLGVVTEP